MENDKQNESSEGRGKNDLVREVVELLTEGRLGLLDLAHVIFLALLFFPLFHEFDR